MRKVIVFMVAGMSSRFGGPKQFARVGVHDETLIELSVMDSLHCNFDDIVFITNPKTEHLFKNVFGNVYREKKVYYVRQKMENYRSRPWGTTDAICCVIEYPNFHNECVFVIVNGDDLYGSENFSKLNTYLEKNVTNYIGGLPILKTIVGEGKVNRGVLFVNKDNKIIELQEKLNISKEDTTIAGLTANVNFLVFTSPTILYLSELLFCFKQKYKDHPSIECFITESVNELIYNKKLELNLLPLEESVIGLTRKEDVPVVRQILLQNTNICSVPEPFRIKMVEPIKQTTREYREKTLHDVGYNPFLLKSDDVFIDLITDSGTGAMSDYQWSAMLLGDEAYAGSKSFYKLKETVHDIFDFQMTIPCHQGRAAENILFPILLEEKKKKYKNVDNPIFISNYHFDTTMAHVELNGCQAVNVVIDESKQTDIFHPFKGNFNIEKLSNEIEKVGSHNVVGIIITITCNSVGGQPVSMDNIEQVCTIGKKFNIPLIMDAARFAENAYFIWKRDVNYRNHSIPSIVKEMFSNIDYMTMSAKKDAIVNMGGLCCVKNNNEMYQLLCSRCVPFEGFITYGGMSGRDIEAMNVGLREGMSYDYLEYRISQVEYLGKKLLENGIPIQYPVGGHAVFIDAKSLLPHIPSNEFPALSLCNELYLEGGIRGVEIGSLLLGRDPKTNEQKESSFEFLRLTIPRRVYTTNHLDYIVKCFVSIKSRLHRLQGLKLEYEPPILRHFTARLIYK
jgi:tryptophanase